MSPGGVVERGSGGGGGGRGSRGSGGSVDGITETVLPHPPWAGLAKSRCHGCQLRHHGLTSIRRAAMQQPHKPQGKVERA